MPASDYLEGLVFGGIMLAAVLGASLVLLRRRFDWLGGAERLAAYGTLATTALLAVHLVPAALGILSRSAAAICAMLALGLAFTVRRSPAGPVPAADPPRESDVLSAALAGLAALLLAAFAAAVARDQLLIAPMAIDTLNFHLPGVARWIQTGSIWQVDTLLPDVAPGNYPNSGDVVLLAAVLPWKNDFLAHLTMYPYWAFTGVAVYALAREVRAPGAAALAAACLVLALPVVAIPALVGSLVDVVMLFGFAAGLLMLVRHHRSGRTAELVLAGLALGISFGTKWYGVSAVAVVVLVWAGASLWSGRPVRTVLRQGLALAGLVTLVGGIWLLRNWVVSGNPFFPVRLAPLGLEIFDAPPDFVRELGGFSLSHYLGRPGIWSEFVLPQFHDALALPGAVIALGFLAAAVGGLRRLPARGGGGLVLAAVGCTAGLIGVYLVTPYSAGGPEGMPVLVGANSRYVVPALVIAAVLVARASGWLRGGPLVLSVLALVAVVDGVRIATSGELGAAEPSLGDWGTGIAVLALAATVAWLVSSSRRSLARFRRERPVAAALAAGALLAGLALAVALGGQEAQKRFNAGRYLGADPTTDHILTKAGFERRVGLAGLWTDEYSPALAAFGPRFGNEVQYVGEFVREMLRRYPRRVDFVAALRRGRYDYLIVGRGRPGAERIPEERWARTAGFEPVTSSENLVLLRAPTRSGADQSMRDRRRRGR